MHAPQVNVQLLPPGSASDWMTVSASGLQITLSIDFGGNVVIRKKRDGNSRYRLYLQFQASTPNLCKLCPAHSYATVPALGESVVIVTGLINVITGGPTGRGTSSLS